MPTKNSARFLRRALDSLKKQTEEYELLVCDSDSTDSTLEILKEYGVTPVSYSDHNWAEGVNIGIQKARGDIIFQFNSDDELLDGAFKTLVEYFKQPSDWFYFPCDLVNSDGSYITMGDDQDISLAKMLKQNQIAGMAVAMRPEFFKKYGYFDYKNFPHASDYELWLRALSMGAEPVQIPQKLVVYHAHGDNLGLKPEGWTECLAMRKKYTELWNKKLA